MSIVTLMKLLGQASGERPPLSYYPLDPSNREIRLLTSFRVDRKDRVECKLMTVPLRCCPPFTALSYVWGEDADRVPIWVNGQTFQATKSLASALKHIPRHWKSKFPGRNGAELWVWADAVCINQSDSNERAHQVQLMRDIFSGAELVMCWLPSASIPDIDDLYHDNYRDHSLCRAFETFELINKELILVEEEAGKTILEMDHSDERLINWLGRWTELRDGSPAREWPYWLKLKWAAVDYFFQLQYWRRVWILQEVALARNPLLFCKSSSLSFPDTFSRVMAWFEVLSYGKLPDPNFVSPAEWHSFISINEYWLRYDLVSGHWQVWMSCHRKKDYTSSWFTMFNGFDLTATEPKDYVYGMLGVMGIEIEVDYSERTSVAKVLHDMIAIWLERYQRSEQEEPSVHAPLHFFPWAGLGRECTDAECQGFSSWAPNPPHFKHGYSHTLFFGKVNADFGVFSDLASRNPSIQGSSLFVSGVVIDSIQELYTSALEFKDLAWFFSELLSDPRNGFGEPSQRRRLLRLLFELLCWEDIPRLIYEARLQASGPDVDEYLIYAYAFVLGVLKGSRNYSAMLESMGLRSDSEDGFMQSLRQTFLVFRDDGGDRAGHESIPSWLQVLLTFETTKKLPRNSKVAQYCQQMGITRLPPKVGRLGSGIIFRTSGGHFGFGSWEAAVGDLACVLKGYRSIALLRKKSDHFLYVGEAKVHGMVHGEASELVKNGKSRVEEIELR